MPQNDNFDPSDGPANPTAAVFAMQTLGVIAETLDNQSMGGEISPYLENLVPVTLQQFQTLKDKEAAKAIICLLEAIAVASPDSFQPYIEKSILPILPFLEDPYQNIQLASFGAISALSISAAKSPVGRAVFIPHLRKLVSQSVKAFHLTSKLRSAVAFLLTHLTALCMGHLGFYLDDLIPLLLVGSRGESLLGLLFQLLLFFFQY